MYFSLLCLLFLFYFPHLIRQKKISNETSFISILIPENNLDNLKTRRPTSISSINSVARELIPL